MTIILTTNKLNVLPQHFFHAKSKKKQPFVYTCSIATQTKTVIIYFLMSKLNNSIVENNKS